MAHKIKTEVKWLQVHICFGDIYLAYSGTLKSLVAVRFLLYFIFLKEIYFVHQSCIYLIKNKNSNRVRTLTQ